MQSASVCIAVHNPKPPSGRHCLVLLRAPVGEVWSAASWQGVFGFRVQGAA